MTPDIQEQTECVERELKQRRRLYARWVEQDKMTQALADKEIQRMEAVLATLLAVRSVVSQIDFGATLDMEALVNAAPLPPQGSLL